MKSLESGLSNGVSTISFRLLLPKIRRAKDFGFGSQIPYNATPLGSQGRRRESYTFMGVSPIAKKIYAFIFLPIACSRPLAGSFMYVYQRILIKVQLS